MKLQLLQKMIKGIFLFILFTVPASSLLAQYEANEAINGDFSSGETNWALTVRAGYEAAFAVNTGEATVAVTLNPDDHNGKIFLTNDRIAGVSPTHQYRVSFKAKADVAGKILSLKVLSYDEVGGKKSRSSDDLSMSTEFEEYSWVFNTNPDFVHEMEVIIRFHNVAVFTFDDVKIQKITDVANGDFEEPHDFAWVSDVNTASGAAGTVSISDASPYEGSKSAMAEVTTSNDTASHLSITSDTKLWIEPGKDYALTFWAKGDAGKKLVTNLQLFDTSATYSGAAVDTFEMTDTYTEYSAFYSFGDTLDFIKTKFFFGLGTGTFYVDNVTFGESEVVEDTLSITSDPITAATVGEAYSYQVTFTGTGTFSISTAPAAAWMSINASGLVSGTPDAAGDVEVTIKLDDGVKPVTQTYTLSVSGGVGVKDLSDASYVMYPNPATSLLHFKGLNEGDVIRIIDITGKQVLQKLIYSESMVVSLDGIKSGVYFVTNGKNDSVSKLIVK